VSTIAVGATGDDDGGDRRGAIYILNLTASETVLRTTKISDYQGGFTGALKDNDQFGKSLAFLGDLDGDGAGDLAVGAFQDDDGGVDAGAVWILFLNLNGTVKAHQKISPTIGGFGGQLAAGDRFGYSLAAAPDLNGDGIDDLVVGARYDDDGGTNRGAIWLLFLDTDGTVKGERKISSTAGGFGGVLSDSDSFGSSVAVLGDLDGDGYDDLLGGACLDDDGGSNRGAAWVLFSDATTYATSAWRNPTVSGHTNPDAYSVSAPAVVGGTFSASVSTFGPASGAVLAGYAKPLELRIGWGALLVDITDPNGELLNMPLRVGDPANFNLPVPMDLTLVGFEISTQALRFDASVMELTNAQDLLLGH
jgi:hypothetical protein